MLWSRRVRLVSAGFVILAAFACSDSNDPDDGGGGGGGGGGGEDANVAGLWLWTVNNITSSCGAETGWSAQVEITQSGSSVSAVSTWHSDGGEHTGTGTIDGNALSISVTYPEEGGTLTARHDVTVASDGDSMSGTETWSWTDGDTMCTGGTATVTVTPQ